MIVDTHVHLSSWTGKGNSLQETFDVLLLEMKQNDIDYAIIIPDCLENDSRIADLDTALKFIDNKKNLFALGSPQIMQRGSSEADKYRKLLAKGLIKGLKFYPGHEPYNALDSRCLPYYELLQDLNCPVVFHTGEISSDPKILNPLDYNDPKYIVEIAKKYPELKVVITHYYWPKIDYCYDITKNIPNIYFEIAGCADDEVLARSGGMDKMRSVLLQTITDRPDKVFFGTDWPLCDSQSESGFKKHIDLVKGLHLTPKQENAVFFENANNIYKLGIGSTR